MLASTLFFIDIGLLLTVLELMIAVLTLIIGVLTMLASEGSTLPPSFQRETSVVVTQCDGAAIFPSTTVEVAQTSYICMTWM